MATDALTGFLRRDFCLTEEALQSLSSDGQRGENLGDDPRIQHNLLVSRFYAECTQENLEKLISFIIGLLPEDEHWASIESFFTRTTGSREALKVLYSSIGPVALYNVAVIAYHQGYTQSAACVGELLYANIEAMDDWLALRTCFLLIDVYLRLEDIPSAETTAAYAEKLLTNFAKGETESANSPSEMKTLSPDWDGRSQGILEVPASYDDAKFCMHIYNARLNGTRDASANNARGVRKEAKNALVAAGDTETRPTAGALLVKARVEQNYSKSFRILASIMTQSPPNIIKKVRPLVLNTLGVLHHCLGRHALAACYFEHSRKAFDSLFRGDVSSFNPKLIHLNVLSSAKDSQVSYNLALQYMKLGDYVRALDLFEICAREDLTYANNSALLWLRMAECCIGIENSKNSRQPFVVHGRGRGRRLVMQPSKSDDGPLMEYAATCARAAVAVLDRRKDGTNDSQRTKEKLYSVVPSGGARKPANGQSTTPAGELPDQDNQIRAAALCIRAYACLSFDPNAVIEASNELQRLYGKSDIDRCELAQLYSAEAYCMLGRPADAAHRIAPLLSVDSPGDASIREMAYVNMALTHVCDGDFEAGSRAAKLALKIFSALQNRSRLLKRETIFATSYIFLRNGEVEAARRCLRSLFNPGE